LFSAGEWNGMSSTASNAIWKDQDMAAKFRKLRPTPWALTIALWDVWRRLPPQQQRQVMKLVGKHGPRLAAKAASKARRYRRP
jgi:predicted Fe-S protein YdhL (DUF1289 family)